MQHTELSGIMKIVTDKKILRKKSTPVGKDFDIKALVKQLKEANATTKNGCGVASIQIGLPFRVAWLSYEDREIVLVNPKILSRSDDRSVVHESCLSIPGLSIPVRRSNSIQIQPNEFKQEVIILSGFIARIVQHEIDHFDGILTVDKKYRPNKKKRKKNK